jgi:hypothetical protein
MTTQIPVMVTGWVTSSLPAIYHLSVCSSG